MALDFSKASTQFVRNLVELGVCDNADCLNAYHPPATPQSKNVGAAQRPTPLYAASVSASTTAGASTRPVIAVDVPCWIRALDSDDFPLADVCHQLSSSPMQMRQSLENFIDALFSSVSRRYGVQLETLVRALRLLERVQMTNIRAHNELLLSQPSLCSGRSSNTGSYGSGENVCGVGAKAGTMMPWSEAPTLPPPPPHREEKAPTPSGQLLRAATMTTPQLGASPSAPVRITGSPACRLGGSYGGDRYGGRPASSLVARGSVFGGSSVSSGTVGPLTDTDGLSYGKCCGAPASSSSFASWCLPTKSPCEQPVSATPNAEDLPSSLNHLQLCTTCAGSPVFTLQYCNVHLLLTACLALSISINEVDVMEAVTEDALMHQLAEMSHCTDLPLQMAARVVCETLRGELSVFDGEVDVLVRRLNIVETCVFATESI